MLFYINFMKKERLETFLGIFTKIAFRRESILVQILLIIVASFSLYHLYFTKENSSFSAMDKSLVHKLKEIGKERNKIGRTLNILNELKRERTVWSEKLLALEASITGGIWLTGIETRSIVRSEEEGRRRPDKADALIFRGFGEIQENVRADPLKRFIQRLAENPSFQESYNPPFLVSISKSGSVSGERLNKMEICFIRKAIGEKE